MSQVPVECRQHGRILLNLASSVSRGPNVTRMNAVYGRALIQQFDLPSAGNHCVEWQVTLDWKNHEGSEASYSSDT
jgi:hypothetical protein